MIKLIYPDGHEVKLHGTDRYDVGVSNDTIDIYSKGAVVATVVKMPGLIVLDTEEED